MKIMDPKMDIGQSDERLYILESNRLLVEMNKIYTLRELSTIMLALTALEVKCQNISL